MKWGYGSAKGLPAGSLYRPTSTYMGLKSETSGRGARRLPGHRIGCSSEASMHLSGLWSGSPHKAIAERCKVSAQVAVSSSRGYCWAVY